MTTKGLKSPYAHIHLSRALKDDLQLWIEFLTSFNGRSVWQEDFEEDISSYRRLWLFGLWSLFSGSMPNCGLSHGCRGVLPRIWWFWSCFPW